MLINRNFTLLWMAQNISLVGTLLFDTTLMLWVATDLMAGQRWAPAVSMGIPLIAAAVALTVGPYAGVVVDRRDKRRTMIQSDIAQAVLLFSFVGILIAASRVLSEPVLLGVIGAVVALNAVAAQFFGPARSVLLGDIVAAEARGRATGYRQATDALGKIFGPTLAAPLLVATGPRWAIAANAASFVLSALLVRRVDPPKLDNRSQPRSAGVRRDFVSGLRVFAELPVLRALLISIVIALLGVGTIAILDVYFITENLATPVRWFGVLSGAFGLGILAGSLVCGRFGDRAGHHRVFSFGMIVFSILLMLYAKQTSLVPALAVIFVFGLVLGAINTSIVPMVLAVVPRPVQGRVWSTFGITNQLTSFVSMAIGGLVAAWLPPKLTYRVLGVSFGRLDSIFFAAGLLSLAAGCYAVLTLRVTNQQSPAEQAAEHLVTESAATGA